MDMERNRGKKNKYQIITKKNVCKNTIYSSCISLVGDVKRVMYTNNDEVDNKESKIVNNNTDLQDNASRSTK